MSTTLYEKRGRRYYPVAESDPALYESLPIGHHLLSVVAGGRMTQYRINPAHAETLAALRDCHQEVATAMLDAMRGTPASQWSIRYPSAAQVLDVLAAKLAQLVAERRMQGRG